ncbi:MAG: nuclear transport factor 2 family protein [Hyphomonadaceae bacterium]
MALSERIIVDEILAQWAGVFAQWDINALAALYTDDALFYGSAPALKIGPAGVRAYFQSLHPAAEPHVAFTDIACATVAPNVIHMAAIAHFSAREGPVARARMTHLYVLRDGAWKIAGHHASPLAS